MGCKVIKKKVQMVYVEVMLFISPMYVRSVGKKPGCILISYPETVCTIKSRHNTFKHNHLYMSYIHVAEIDKNGVTHPDSIITGLS